MEIKRGSRGGKLGRVSKLFSFSKSKTEKKKKGKQNQNKSFYFLPNLPPRPTLDEQQFIKQNKYLRTNKTNKKRQDMSDHLLILLFGLFFVVLFFIVEMATIFMFLLMSQKRNYSYSLE